MVAGSANFLTLYFFTGLQKPRFRGLRRWKFRCPHCPALALQALSPAAHQQPSIAGLLFILSDLHTIPCEHYANYFYAHQLEAVVGLDWTHTCALLCGQKRHTVIISVLSTE